MSQKILTFMDENDDVDDVDDVALMAAIGKQADQSIAHLEAVRAAA